ncbi:MAG: hypothetical protein DLM52_05580 [Chthoniobacterales bacterium]|nr:MAG: hypothetical protein DLM52_05580 [Chthoniobacterales bacterium]
MKKFLTLLISCSLALAASAIAQQTEEQPTPTEKKQGEKGHPKEVKSTPTVESIPQRHAETRGAPKGLSKQPASQMEAATPGAPKGDKGEHANRKERANRHGPDKQATPTSAATSAQSSAAVNATATPVATAAPTAAGAAQANNPNRGKKLDKQQVQKIKTEHANFRAQPKPEKVPSVTFNESYRINGADRWQGEKYTVFRSYHPERHDQGWYRSRYNRVELIGGGYYFWNAGYWYPAWGYSPSAEYYAYDGPIYVGSRAEPPDRVIADVQASLQEQGYYRGEVDGLLGPITREALTAYQSDHGLYTTAAIDEPTLDSLDLG